MTHTDTMQTISQNRSENGTENWVEMAILCNMMVSAEISDIALAKLREGYFQDERNHLLFRALQQLSPSPSGTRFEALLRLLEENGLIEAVGGRAYVYCVYLYVPVGGIDEFMRLLIRRAA
jgi:replicative DNA helicase